MSEQSINVTVILVQQEINNFLAKYSNENPLKIIFSFPNFKQKLLNKILSQTPNHYLMIETQKTLVHHNDDIKYSLENKEKTKILISMNIHKILIENCYQVG